MVQRVVVLWMVLGVVVLFEFLIASYRLVAVIGRKWSVTVAVAKSDRKAGAEIVFCEYKVCVSVRL